MIIIAAIIACPLAYLLMKEWLNGYAYRIDIGTSAFLLSIAALVMVTVLLIVLQTMKAAIANPVKSLRTE